MATEEEKTEQPTSKRLDDERRKGNVGKSNEVVGAGVLFFASIYLIFFSSNLLDELKKIMLYAFGFIGHEMDSTIYYDITSKVIFSSLYALAPLFALIILFALILNVAQFGFVFTPLKVKFEKINPINGFKNLFSIKKVIESFKLMFKLMIIIIIMYVVILLVANKIISIMDMGLGASLNVLVELTSYFVGAILLIIIIFALLDFYFTKHYYIKSLKMTKQEIKDEYKQMDGNPEIKSRIRQIQAKMSQQSMLKDVPNASVIITNPTHYAVALQYEQGITSAPKIVAKGIDFLALKIKDVGRQNDIPIVENPSLARALYDQLEINEEIPEEFYKAIADIFTHIYNLDNE